MTFALINENKEFVQTTENHAIEWRGNFIPNLYALTPKQRKDLGVYEFIPGPATTKFCNKETSTYSVNNTKGTVTEQVNESPFTQEQIDSYKSRSKAEVDQAADNCRKRFVSPGMYIQQEYLQAEEEAKTWLADTAQPCPLSVTSWATAKNFTNEEAAADIVSTATTFRGILNAVRNIRLVTKANINLATTCQEVETSLNSALASLAAL